MREENCQSISSLCTHTQQQLQLSSHSERHTIQREFAWAHVRTYVHTFINTYVCMEYSANFRLRKLRCCVHIQVLIDMYVHTYTAYAYMCLYLYISRTHTGLFVQHLKYRGTCHFQFYMVKYTFVCMQIHMDRLVSNFDVFYINSNIVHL